MQNSWSISHEIKINHKKKLENNYKTDIKNSLVVLLSTLKNKK